MTIDYAQDVARITLRKNLWQVSRMYCEKDHHCVPLEHISERVVTSPSIVPERVVQTRKVWVDLSRYRWRIPSQTQQSLLLIALLDGESWMKIIINTLRRRKASWIRVGVCGWKHRGTLPASHRPYLTRHRTRVDIDQFQSPTTNPHDQSNRVLSHLLNKRQSRVYRLQAASERCAYWIPCITYHDIRSQLSIIGQQSRVRLVAPALVRNINIWLPRLVHHWFFEFTQNLHVQRPAYDASNWRWAGYSGFSRGRKISIPVVLFIGRGYTGKPSKNLLIWISPLRLIGIVFAKAI